MGRLFTSIVREADTDARYVKRKKEKGVWQKEKDHIMAQIKELEDEMASFTATHEGEINNLLQEYWTMRKQAGEAWEVSCFRKHTDDIEDYMNTMTVKLGLVFR